MIHQWKGLHEDYNMENQKINILNITPSFNNISPTVVNNT